MIKPVWHNWVITINQASSSQNLQQAFVIHRRRYGDTSLLLELFTLDEGRIGVIARGAATAKGERKAILQPFVPIQATWVGRGELKVLSQLETIARPLSLRGRFLYCGFYLNELIMRLLKRHDPIPELFSLYAHALRQLAEGQDAENTLRYFELGLLQALGYGPVLELEAASEQPIELQKIYWYEVETGPGSKPLEHLPSVHGDTLLALSAGQPLTKQQKNEALPLMRYILQFYLGDKPLKSRELFS